ncbi:MAG TPA: MBL fold metallo-hydrolase [Vicinamibacterales bacterium]|jgi:glyoxylase-like metal-dependent hydrolase (beta-lactamase superfamily II)|nr:MBL fold metallo-hydrolase [Vicinamibacterales bacterium]
MRAAILVCACLALVAAAAPDEAPAIESGTLPAGWPTGRSCPEAEFQVHSYNDDFAILRQSGCTNFEKPFLYLVFGADKALLVDTGAKGADPARPVAAARDAWAARHGGRRLPLVVLHSHGHGDHIAGDASLAALPDTTVIAATPEALQHALGFRNWPADVATIDLGGRTLDVVPIPGHQPASVAIYDRRTAVLLTGDTLYPGRLYVRDAKAFEASVQRLVDFTASRPVAHVLGAHIEQSRTPFVDYPEGTTSQPDEHVLELGRAHLLELRDALRAMNGAIVRQRLRDFTIWPVS